MKKISKIISLVLCVLMVAGVLCGCGEKTVQTGDKFTYWGTLDTNVAQTHTSYSELLMYQEMIKATGTDVEFIHPASGTTGSEAFQILLSSGDYPDMIEYSWNSYTGGPDQAIGDGVIIALNDYMEDYAPNYYDIMEGEKGKEAGYMYKADAFSNNGNYYGFKGITIDSYSSFGGLMIRKDMLDKWGLDIPVTIDDWTNVFKVAKENGVKAPLTGDKALFAFNGRPMFENGWNVGKGFYVVDGEVKFGPFEKEYKDYIKQMTEWARAGYVDMDFVTNDSTTIAGYMTNGSSIATFGYIGGGMGKYLAAMEERDPNYNVVACPFPVMNEGDVPYFQDVMANATDPCIAISAQCGADNEDRYKEAIKFCDYLYSDEGMLLKSFGIEGDTYTIEKDEDGREHYVYTDKVKNYEEFGGTSMSAALYHFMLPANHPGFNQHPDYLDGFYEYQQQKDALRTWNEYIEVARTHVLPKLNYTGEEATEKANIESMGLDNLNAAIFNIILGKGSMDNYDKLVVGQAKKDGYDRLLKITQNAYDRYMKVINESK